MLKLQSVAFLGLKIHFEQVHNRPVFKTLCSARFKALSL